MTAPAIEQQDPRPRQATRRDHEMKLKRRRKKTRASLKAKARQWKRRRS